MNFSGSLIRHILPQSTEAVFRRGIAYAKNGQVKNAREEAGKIKASVQGSVAYEVEMWQEAGGIRGSCMCAYALNGDYCKHVVALGAYWDLLRDISLPSDTEAATACLQAPHGRCLLEECTLCSWK